MDIDKENIKAQKPTAPASLIEEIERFSFPLLDGTPYGIELRKILSRYRPAPSSADEELREEILEIVRTEPELPGEPDARTIKAMEEVGPIMNARVAVSFAKKCIEKRLKEYFSRHPAHVKSADRCAELVKRLRAL